MRTRVGGLCNCSCTKRGRSPLLGVVLLPVFIVVFVMAYISASHSPTPDDFSVTLAGPSATTSQLESDIEERVPGAFDITRTAKDEVATATGAVI